MDQQGENSPEQQRYDNPEQLHSIEEKPVYAAKPEIVLLPPEREKNLQRREGFTYHLAQIDYQKGCKFGLGIKHFQNKVFVSRVDEGSLSSLALVVGDRIVDVNGAPVSDKDVARTMLLRSLQKTHTVSLAIERAEAEDAKNAVKAALNASEMQAPSVAMASDIQEIVKRQKKKMEKQSPEHRPGIIRPRSQPSRDRRVSVNSDRKEIIISTDHEGKALKHVGPQK